MTPGVLLALASVYLIWGTSYLAIRFSLEGLPPFGLAGMRFLTAGLFLLIVLRLRGHRLPTVPQWGGALIVGTLLLTIGNGGVVVAEQWVTSATTAIMVATVGLWTAVFSTLFGHHATRWEWVAVMLGVGGVGLLNLDKDLQAHPVGAAILLVASASWAFGSAWSKRLPMPPGMMSSAAQMCAGGLVLLAIGWIRGESLPQHAPLKAWLGLAYLCVFGSIIGFSAFSYLLQRVRPALATSYAYVNPIVAVAVGIGLGHEHVSLYAMVALGVILCSVALVAREQRKHA